MTPSDMAKIAHNNRTPKERKELAQKAQEAARKKYGDDRMKLVRAGKQLKACPCDDAYCKGYDIGQEKKEMDSQFMDR